MLGAGLGASSAHSAQIDPSGFLLVSELASEGKQPLPQAFASPRKISLQAGTSAYLEALPLVEGDGIIASLPKSSTSHGKSSAVLSLVPTLPGL
jgi:hypothetical protein